MPYHPSRGRSAARKPRIYEQIVSEKVFQAHVIQVARLNGFRAPMEDPLQPPLDLILHIFDSRKSQGVGFPDLVFCKPGEVNEEGETISPGRLILSELKSEKGRLRPEQKLWLKALKTVPGTEVYVWRPSDFEDIKQILGGADNQLFL